MPASLQSGAYRLLAVFESSSSSDAWYRLLQNPAGDLSCDCPAWIFKKNSETRGCPHTAFMQDLLTRRNFTQLGNAYALDTQTTLNALDTWWHGGLQGEWTIESRLLRFKSAPYLFVHTTLLLGTGDVSSCYIGFSERRINMQRVYERVAGWCGYAHAADIARLGGFPMAGAQPEHVKVAKTAKKPGLSSFLRLTEKVDLGDGLRPEERAENTLQMFLGTELYQELETNHFLDVSSYLYPQRVYRMRRDYPKKQRERRVRVFEQGKYTKDFCIVRDQVCPEADWFLGTWLSLLSDEAHAISVVKHHNVFSPHSDDYYVRENETIPAIWQARAV